MERFWYCKKRSSRHARRHGFPLAMARRFDGAAQGLPAKRADGSCLYCGVWTCDHVLLANAGVDERQQVCVPIGTDLGSESPSHQLSSGTFGRTQDAERVVTAREFPVQHESLAIEDGSIISGLEFQSANDGTFRTALGAGRQHGLVASSSVCTDHVISQFRPIGEA